MIESYKAFWKNYVNFSGKAGRPEFWWSCLCNIIVSAIITIVGTVVGLPILGSIFSLAILIPSLSVTIRRLRDAGFHWAWIFLCLTGIGSIVVLIMCAMQSK